LWLALAVVWTVAFAAAGWLNLPRAQQIQHHPELLNRLSSEAASILTGPDFTVRPVRGALVWSEDRRSARMLNGARLTFPAITTDERVTFFEGEYRQALSAEADLLRGPYLLELLALWFAPILLAGFASLLLHRRDTQPAEYSKVCSTVCSTANRESPQRGPQSLA